MSFRYGNREQITLFPQSVQELDTASAIFMNNSGVPGLFTSRGSQGMKLWSFTANAL